VQGRAMEMPEDSSQRLALGAQQSLGKEATNLLMEPVLGTTEKVGTAILGSGHPIMVKTSKPRATKMLPRSRAKISAHAEAVVRPERI